MERTIYSELLKWKNKSGHKPLLLLGARQVGKTYILKAFGNREFENVVYVNCHRESFVTELFRDFDTKRIITELERYYETDIKAGATLLVLDEVQEIHNGLASLKYFCEEMPELHVAVAGSLLGISLREDESFPVGKVNILKMFPMTFNEYLYASGYHRMVQALDNRDWEGFRTLESKLKELLREYYFVGGMPEAVAKYLETRDVKSVREVQREILETYYHDMSKHTKTQIQRIHQVWSSIPAQLSKENKKFFYGDIKRGARAKDFELAIQWLVDAGLVYRLERCKNPTQPLKFYADSSAFKLYLIDCGLLACLSDSNPYSLLLGDNAFVEYKGAFAENYVLQHLMTVPDTSVYYFSKDNSTMEIDFLFQTNTRIIPIEVKASVNTKSKSLSRFVCEDFKEKNLKALRLSLRAYEDQGWVENVPLYAVDSFIRPSIMRSQS